jgi:hypothetical protein
VAFNTIRPFKELDIISLVDIILLLLIFALLIEVGGESGKTKTRGEGDRETTLIIDVSRRRIPDHPDRIQIQIVYDNDTNRVNFPPDDRFVSLPHRDFMEMEEVRQTMKHIDAYLNAPILYPVKAVEVSAQNRIPFKVVDLFVRQFSFVEQENFSLAYGKGPGQ